MITALAGGIGAARFLKGVLQVLPAEELAVVGNTGDDIILSGLRICPDLDTVLYTLTGRANPVTGWGVKDETFHCLAQLERLGEPTWFQLGDRDLATHLFRTQRLAEGWTLARVTRELGRRSGLGCRLLPMCEGYHPTMVHTNQGVLHLQEYLVRERCQPQVQGFVYTDVHRASLDADVDRVISQSQAVIFCPSNPFISLQPILEVPGMREQLSQGPPVVAVTPIIGDRAVKGPAAKMLRELGLPVSAVGVARCYQGLVQRFVLDRRDAALAGEIESLGMEVQLAETLMTDEAASHRLARDILEQL